MGEIENPERNLPHALTVIVIAFTVIYILTSAVFFYLVPTGRVKSDETLAAQAGEALFGPAGGIVFASIVIISVLGTLVAYLIVLPRVYYAMAKNEVFFKSFGEPRPRFGTPSPRDYDSSGSCRHLDSVGKFRANRILFFLCRSVVHRSSRSGTF